MNEKSWSIVGLLYMALILGASLPVTVYVFQKGVYFFDLLYARFFIASAVLLCICVFNKKNMLQEWKTGVLLGIVNASVFMLNYAGIAFTRADNAAFITGTFIIPTMIIGAYMSDEKITTNLKWSAGMIVFGFLFLNRGFTVPNFGDMLLVCGAIGMGFHINLVKYFSNKINPLVTTTHQMMVITLLAWLAAILTTVSPRLSPFTPSIFYWVVGLAIFASVIAFFIQIHAQRKVPPSTAGLILTLMPISGAVLSWVFGLATIESNTIFGGILIIIAIVIGIKKSKENDQQGK